MQEQSKPRRFYRLPDILGSKKAGTPPIIPVSPSVWWAGVRSGRFPKGIKLSPNVTAWDSKAIDALLDELAGREMRPPDMKRRGAELAWTKRTPESSGSICRLCNGSGQDPSTGELCTRCGGSGYEPRK